MNFPLNFTNQDKIELLQRWILVNSHLYYNLDFSIITDHRFDSECKQLCALRDEFPYEYSKSRYSYVLDETFNGSTGVGYVEKLNEKDYESITFHAEFITRKK